MNLYKIFGSIVHSSLAMELRFRRQTLLFTPSKKKIQDLGECLHRESKKVRKIRQKIFARLLHLRDRKNPQIPIVLKYEKVLQNKPSF